MRFHRGDFVHVAADLGPSMSHFDADKDAIVIGSYADQFGGDNHDSYTLLLLEPDGTGHQCSWYYGSQLAFLRQGEESDISAVTTKTKQRDAEQGELSWIVANWPSIKNAPPSASVHALAALLNITVDQLWGRHGEGLAYYTNAWRVLDLFWDALDAGTVDAVHERARELLALAAQRSNA